MKFEVAIEPLKERRAYRAEDLQVITYLMLPVMPRPRGQMNVDLMSNGYIRVRGEAAEVTEADLRRMGDALFEAAIAVTMESES